MDVVMSVSGAMTPYDSETIAVDGTTKTLTQSKVTPTTNASERDLGHARMVYITVEDGAVRYTMDGSAPVANGNGHVWAVPDKLTIVNYQIMKTLKFTKDTGTNGELHVTYLR